MKKLYFLFTLIMLLFSACQKREVLGEYCDISFQVNYPETKVDFSGDAFSFAAGDELALNIDGINSTVLSNAESGNVNSFRGLLLKKGVKKNDADWYVTYPSSVEMPSAGVITSTVPTIQKAPFDKSALVMYSDIVTADYDEDNIPVLAFNLKQTLGLVRITVVNTEADYSSDCMEYIQLSSSSILSGTFSIDIHDDSPQPVFSQYNFNNVISSFDGDVSLGEGVAHTVFLFVNPAELDDCVLKVVTDKHIFTRNATASISVDKGGIVAIKSLDLNSFAVKERSSVKKRVACWGDSFTNPNYASYTINLQDLLGDTWTVYNGGISGNRVDEIAARQGGLGIVTNEEFTLPASGSVKVDGILRTRSNACEEGFFRMRLYGGLLANPCLINGIECNVESRSSYPSGEDIDDPSATFSATITRTCSGDPVVIPEHTPIISYGARMLKDVDLQIIYMGTNGKIVYNGSLGDANYYDNLVNYHKYMTEFNTHKTDYIILGYHTWNWNQYYWDRFCNEFGTTRMVDLRHIIPDRGRELMVRTGAYPDEASIPQSELDRVDDGQWPYCFWSSSADPHPSEYGCRAMAIVIHERMQELGYLD